MIIEKNIPLAPHVGTPKDGTHAVLVRMEVGDSVRTDKTLHQVNAAMAYAHGKTGFKYTQRRIPEGRRVWRIK